MVCMVRFGLRWNLLWYMHVLHHCIQEMKLHCVGGRGKDREVAISRIDGLKYQVATHEGEVKDDASTFLWIVHRSSQDPSNQFNVSCVCALLGARTQDVMSKIKTYMNHTKDLGSRNAVVCPQAFLQNMYSMQMFTFALIERGRETKTTYRYRGWYFCIVFVYIYIHVILFLSLSLYIYIYYVILHIHMIPLFFRFAHSQIWMGSLCACIYTRERGESNNR